MIKIKCNICECEFIPEKDKHYISRDEIKTGLSTVVGGLEEKMYDTFDCPQCGCQMVIQERKRAFCVCVREKAKEEIEESDAE